MTQVNKVAWVTVDPRAGLETLVNRVQSVSLGHEARLVPLDSLAPVVRRDLRASQAVKVKLTNRSTVCMCIFQ